MPHITVPPEGNLQTAKYIIIGEQPGRIESRMHRPFVGPAGRELDEDLQMVGIVRADCYLTNVIKNFDNPLDHYISYNPRQKSATATAAFYKCVENLYEELKDSSAIIVTVGNVALYALTGMWGITKWRGSRIASTLLPGRIVYATLHPATVLPPKNQYLNKTLIQFDFKKAKHEVDGNYIPTQRGILTEPSFQQTMEFLQECETAGLRGEIIHYDIEVMGMDVSQEEVSCISFAINRDIPTAISIPFFRGHDYFLPDQETVVWLKIASILENPKITKCGQNIIFDTHFLLRKYGIKGTNFHDTMIAQRTLMPEFRIGLDFITSMYTDHPYYKDDGKKNFGGANWHQLYAYNATDSLICLEALPKQLSELRQLQTEEAYDRQRKLIEPLTYMMERGLRIDLTKFRERRASLDIEIETLQEELNKVAGKALNPNSPKQLVEYFYGQLGQKAYKNRKTGNASTDNLAMKRLARKGFEAAKLVLEIRKRVKLASTYLEESKLSADGRLRCSYNPVGTIFSRLSSSSNIFGEGMNLQNLPHSFRDILLADEGYIWYSFDLAQAENRIVAYVGRITPMIQAFENGSDVHRLTAGLVFNKPPEEISDEPGSSTLGDGKHSERDWGKRCIAAGTEVLTPQGWIKVEDWDWQQTEIAQWEPANREISFVHATNYTAYESDVITLHSRNAHVTGSPNHKIPLWRSDRQQFRTTTLADVKTNSFNSGIPINGMFKNSESLLTAEEVLLLVAFQADGSFNGAGHRFKFHKERKIDRIKNILRLNNMPFTVGKNSDGSTSIYFRGPYWLTKKFDNTLLMLGVEQMKLFVKELAKWDGYTQTNGGYQYFSTNKNNVIWAQTIAHLCGYVATFEERSPTGFGKKPLYVLHYNEGTANATLVSHTKYLHKEKTVVFGPEVPSGFIMIRSNNTISVTGNSNHGLNYDFGYRSFALLYEMSERDARFIVESYHKAYPGVRQGFHAHVRRSLRETRTLTNLMGRRTLFLGPLVDETFKEAYSCIPQGTVGDVINERGLEYVYYDQQQFGPVELLTQTHDDIGFQIPISVGWHEHARMLMAIKQSLETPLKVHDYTFTIPADLTIGLNMAKKQGRELKWKAFPQTVEKLAEALENIYNDLRKQHEQTGVN
jgi:uracil-DNA glycosylase family 4